MKRLLLILISATSLLVIFFIITAFSSLNKKKDCEDAKSSADDAYTYFKKAYRAESLDDAQHYAKKGMSSPEDAEDEATDSDCDCDDAAGVAEEAYSYGKKAYNADDLSDAYYYAKKAMEAAGEITDEAEACEDE